VSESQPSASSLVGTILADRYRIVQLLGEGAMGAVYLGEHLKMGRRDAIKVLRDSLATDREATLRFLRGARNVSSIRHPNVCTIYDFSDTADGLQFMAMEFVQGETLKDLLDRERKLPLERAVHIAAQTADALQAAHDAGIVHRDLKPGNIMLTRDRDGRDLVKVVDFDIAKGADTDGEEVTRLGFVVGTPEYMSPEQLMGEHLDGRSDVYSLALVLFRMLTGSLPFRAETTQDVMIQRLTHAPLRLAEALPGGQFPERLQHAIARALERRAADRWGNAVEFGREITAAVTAPDLGWSAPVAPRPAVHAEPPATTVAPAAPAHPRAGTMHAPPPKSRGGRRNLAIGAALAVVLALAATAMLLQNGGGTASGETPADSPSALMGADGAADRGADRTVSAPPDTGARNVARDADAATTTPPADPAGGTTTPVTDPGSSGNDGAAAIVVTPESAVDMALDLLAHFPADFDSPPPAARTLAAVMDSGRAIWRTPGVPAKAREVAAYVVATAHAFERDWRSCVAWSDSAIMLDLAQSGPMDLRTRCHSQIR
jgi:serine/threonine-protein kinase